MVCPSGARQAIQTAMNTNPHLTRLPHPRASIVSPPGLDQTTGTAKLLTFKEIYNTVKGDFVVLPCDLICSVSPEKVIQAWTSSVINPVGSLRVKRLLSGETIQQNGGFCMWYDTKVTPVKGEETDFGVFAPLPSQTHPCPKGFLMPHMSQLVTTMPADSFSDMMEERRALLIRTGLMRSHPKIRLTTSLRDAHFYIFPRWILDVAENNSSLETIGEDLMGWWAKAEWQPGLARKMRIPEVLQEHDQKTPRPRDYASPIPSPAAEQQSPAEGPCDMYRFPHDESAPVIPPIIAYTHPFDEAPEAIVRRADTSRLLLQVSLELAKLPSIEEGGKSPLAHAKKIAFPEGVQSRTTITTANSLIEGGVIVEQKTSIQQSVIGANCIISEGVKLLRCVVMDGVTVGRYCRLTGCILGRRSIIKEGVTLTDCEVQENLIIEEKSKFLDPYSLISPYPKTLANQIT